MSFDPEEILLDTVFESTPEEPNREDDDVTEPSDDLYEPWDNEDDPVERRRDPLR